MTPDHVDCVYCPSIVSIVLRLCLLSFDCVYCPSIVSIVLRLCLLSFFIRHPILETFSQVTVVAVSSQRPSSSNVLAPDMNCLNPLKTVVLAEVDLQNSVLTLKVLFKGYCVEVVLIHQISHTPLRKINTTGKRPVTLIGHVVDWNENSSTAPSEISLS